MSEFGRYVNRLPRTTPPDLSRALSDVHRDLIDELGYFKADASGAKKRPISKKLGDVLNVRDFGAVGDGIQDDRAAIVAAVAAARGKNICFPDGQYLINTDGGTITLEEVGLLGELVQDGANASVDRGAVLRITGTTNSPFTIRRGVQISSLGFFYPNQVDSATPTVYPPTLDFDNSASDIQFVYIQNNVVYNAYRFINIDHPTGGVGHIWITDNTICGLHRSIEIEWNLEVIKIMGNSFTFGHWLAATEAGARSYMRSNARALLYKRGDGIFFSDNMLFGQLAGITMDAGQLVQLCRIDGNTFDQTRYGIACAGAGNFTLSQITDNDFYSVNTASTSDEGVGIFLANSGTGTDRLVISGNTFAQASSDCIQLTGTQARRLTIVGNSFSGFASGRSSGGYAAVQANSPNTNITFVGNDVEGQSNAYANGLIIAAANNVHCHSNSFIACNTAISVSSAGSLNLSGNTSYTTVSALSDSISGVTGRIHQTGNRWDKASGNDGKPAFLGRKNASQTFNSGTATDVTWGAEIYDKGGDFASPSFTAPSELGVRRYRFSWSLFHDNTVTAGDRWQILLTATGSTTAWSYRVGAADFNSVTGSVTIEMNGGDTARLQVQRVGGAGNFVTQNDANANFFCGEMIE